jgi:putative heme-binding domain-containing protein
LIRLQPVATEEHARLVFSRMAENNSLCKILDPLARTLAQTNVPVLDRITDSIRLERVKFWQAWYQNRFGKALQLAAQSAEKSDEQLLEFLLSDKAKGGNRLRGGEVYEKLQCNSCHGGGATPGREGKIFGPDLSGVTRRLSPREFAESLVYPSKQVAERYKGYEVTLNDGSSLSGFITEQNDTTVTLADREQVHRIARSQIRSLAPQSSSLMPDHLLNVLSWEEVRDLIAFLDEKPMQGGAAR